MIGDLVRVVRAEDLLVCAFELDGLEVTSTPPNRELRAVPGAPARRLIIHLPPQHIAEEAFVEASEALAGARAAGPSRVAFDVPAARLPVPYRLPAILELLRGCTLHVPESARPDPGSDAGFVELLSYWFNPPTLSEPKSGETAIELPFRLILAPDESAGFHHATGPVVAPGTTRAELWHSRLGVAPDEEGGEDDADRRPVRAIWMRNGDGPPWSPTTPQWANDAEPGDRNPFDHNAITQRDRHDIVHLSGNRRYARQTGSGFYASPVAVRRLALSSLGAWLSSRGAWDPPLSISSVLDWTHRATQGRDHFVRIVKAGFLYPFCHLAALITVTERRFAAAAGDPAALIQRDFIVVRQPLRHFPPGAAPVGRAFTMPLHSVHLRTLVTPEIEKPDDSPNCFLIRPRQSAEPLAFQLTGTDAEPDNHSIDFASPLVWVDSTSAWDVDAINKARTDYAAATPAGIPLGGAQLALAPGQNGDTTYTAEKLVFTAQAWDPMPSQPVLPPADKQPGFWPELVRADVRAPALDILVGQNQTATIGYHKSYRDNGFGGTNHSEVIAELLGSTVPLDFGGKGDRAGGLMQPNMDVAGLSRRLGPVGGTGALAEVAAGTFDPKNFFTSKARLFGVFTLDQVLHRVTGSEPSHTPRIVTVGGAESRVARIEWTPLAQSYPPKPNAKFVVKDTTRVKVEATIDARGTTPRSDIEARMADFEIHLVPPKRFVEVAFDELSFVARAGRKPEVDVKLGDVRFVGPLSFVEELKRLIPLDGFSDPPALDVTPDGIRSSLSLALPNLSVGVFALQNVNLGAGFAIPFTERALTVSFNFCKREQPFGLTVSLFGGGGFFGLSIDPDGVQMLEAALEFGASCAINLGVAQGGVHVMAGIYFKIESGKGVTLTGYFRLGGNMSVLGIISVSIEINLSFTYQEAKKAVGRATITVEIDVFLFSTSVEIECERKFSGSSDDPTFAQFMGAEIDPDPAKTVRPWHTYCYAYA